MRLRMLADGTRYWMQPTHDGRWHVGAYHPHVAHRPERIVADITVAADALEQCLGEIIRAPRRDPVGAVVDLPWFPLGADVTDPPLPPALHDVLIAWRPVEHDDPVVDIGYRRRDGRWVLTGTSDQVVRPLAWTCRPSLPRELAGGDA